MARRVNDLGSSAIQQMNPALDRFGIGDKVGDPLAGTVVVSFEPKAQWCRGDLVEAAVG